MTKAERVAANNLEAVEKWQRWLTGPIRDHVLTLHLHRTVWDGLQDVIASNNELPRDSVLWEYLFGTYTAAQVSALRRLSELDSQSASLGQLLHQLCAGDRRVTLEWWLSGWPTNWGRKDEGTEMFESVAGAGATEFPPNRACDDLRLLQAATQQAKHYVDKQVAHMDKQEFDRTRLPTVSDVHNAIDLIRDLWMRYSLLITRTPHAQSELNLPLTNFRDPLKVPWIQQT